MFSDLQELTFNKVSRPSRIEYIQKSPAPVVTCFISKYHLFNIEILRGVYGRFRLFQLAYNYFV